MAINFREKVFDNGRILSQGYKTLSKSVKLRFLHEYIQSLDLDYDYKKINELYEFIEQNIEKRNGLTKSLASARWLYVDDKHIETIPHKETVQKVLHQEVNINSEGEYIFGNKKIIIKPKILLIKKNVNKTFFYLLQINIILSLLEKSFRHSIL